MGFIPVAGEVSPVQIQGVATVRGSILSGLTLLMLVAACEPWTPTPLIDGYQIWVMNSQEKYIGDAQDTLILGPQIETIGVAPGVIVVNCGLNEVVVNEFANTVGFNLIDTRTGVIWKGLTAAEAEQKLKSRNIPMPEMRPLSSYLP
jgi:hypothetical protein